MAHNLLRYNPVPYIPPLYSFKANIMNFMSYNFLYDTLSLYQFRSNFSNFFRLDIALKKHSQYETYERLWHTAASYIPPLYSFKDNIVHFMSYNFLYDPLSLFQFRSNVNNVLLLETSSK